MLILLQKALNLFNAALVTPTYYVFFTSSTIVTSAILFQGFHGSVTSIVTVVLGFLQICSGVVLLQMSKSAKDVPDAAVFKGDLDQVREIAEQEQPESEPKADAIRGTAAIIRRISQSRQKMEMAEAQRLHEEKERDHLEPLAENEVVEWDGLRRRKTVIGDGPSMVRRKTVVHPPLGMSSFPDYDGVDGDLPHHANTDPTNDNRDTVNFFETMRNRAQSAIGTIRSPHGRHDNERSPMHPVALTEISVGPSKSGDETPIDPYGPGSLEEAHEHIYGLPPGLRGAPSRKESGSTLHIPPASARRQFSFTNVFRKDTPDSDTAYHGARSPSGRSKAASEKKARKNATEEERLGLVKGDSSARLVDEAAVPQIPLRHTHSESQSTISSGSSRGNPRGYHRPYDDAESESDNDWHITSPPRSNPSPDEPGYQPTSYGTARAMPVTATASPPRRKDVPGLPRTGPLPNSAQYQQRASMTQAPLYYSQTSAGTVPTERASRSRDRSRSEVEYERSRTRFESRGRDRHEPSNQGPSGGGTGAFI